MYTDAQYTQVTQIAAAQVKASRDILEEVKYWPEEQANATYLRNILILTQEMIFLMNAQISLLIEIKSNTSY